MQDYISTQQLTAVTTCMDKFKEDSARWIVLLAQMQSGKSDTYMFVAFESLRLKKVKKVVIIAGFQDKELVKQFKTYDETLDMYDVYLQVTPGIEMVDHKSRREIKNTIRTSIDFISGQDLKKSEHYDTLKDSQDVLFIWDESHYAQSKINRPYIFLKTIGISPYGDDEELKARNWFFISVSATPFSELSDIVHEDQKSKEVVRIQPGDNYIGLAKFIENKQIMGYKDWDNELSIALKKQRDNTIPGYSIVRVRGEKKMNKAIKIIDDIKIDYEIYDLEQKTITRKNKDPSKMQSFDGLKDPPQRAKCILIRGACRMGQRVPAMHIEFVMETSKDANTDVILQGLLGRMCGYNSNMSLKIYLHQKFIVSGEIEKYLTLMTESDRTAIPMRGKNLQNTYAYLAKWSHAIPVLYAPLDKDKDQDKDEDYFEYEKEKNIRLLKNHYNYNSTVNHNDHDVSREIKDQLHNIDVKDIHIHNIANKKGAIHSTFAEMPRLIKDALAAKEPLAKIPDGCGFKSNETEINVMYFNTSIPGFPEFPKGSYVLYGRVKNLHQGIPLTTKLEAFTRVQEDKTVIYGNGSYSIEAPIESWRNLSIMQKYIDEVVGISRPGGQRCITSNKSADNDWQGIIVSTKVLAALEKDGDIYNYIKSTYNYILKVKKTRGRKANYLKPDQIKLSTIEW